MPIPRVAIVGRPNVGKSSLLNMLAGEKVSIVDPTPGTTRDRVSIIVDLPPPDSGPVKPVEIVDTGGFGVYVADGRRFDDVGADLAALTPDIEFQIAQAIESADLVLFAVDAQAGITPQDLEIARLLREQRLGAKGSKRGARRVPVRIAATKVDGPKWEAHAHELAGLGLGDCLMCSAKNNYMRRDFTDALYEVFPEPETGAASPIADLSIAIVGKRNAGKSTLVNTLAGQPRVIVSEIAGTTRDAIDVRFEMGGRSILAIDTAGVRRKKSFQDRIEHFAFDRVQRAIARADVVLVLIDATEKVSQVDEQVAMLTQKTFKPAIIVVNKWDLVVGRRGPNGKIVTSEDYETYLRAELAGLSYAPIAFISARDGENIRQTIELAFELQQQAGRRVTTGRLNRLLEEIVQRRGPASKLGTRAKIYYVAQVKTHPPTILAIVNKPELFAPNYQRFLVNRFREALPFPEVPIRLVIRGRNKGKTVDETVAAARHGLEAPGADADAFFED